MFSLLALCFASSALSAPVISATEKFSVRAVPNPAFVQDGPSALRYAYNKYGIPLPQGLDKRQSSGTVSATPNGADLQYLCPVTVGGQSLNLNFDTGSSDLWVFSSLQPSNQVTGHDIYTPTSSSSYQVMDDATWAIQYGDGSSASGIVGTETVNIGGISVTSQAVELATTVSSSFTGNTNSDGILGLAFSALNSVDPEPQNTWFENAAPSLSKGLFTADLKKGAVGSYNFGYIDPKYTAVQYANLDNSRGYWGFNINASYYVGKTKYADSTQTQGMIDTGTTLMLMGDALVKNYYKAVKGAIYAPSNGGWIFPCKATLPDLKVAFGKKFATVPGSLINYSVISSTMCFGGLQSTGAGSTLPYIYGDIFLKANLAVFDLSNNRVGFQSKKV